MKTILLAIQIVVAVFSLGYVFGIAFKLAYNLIDNKTKKVCDVCFRDIKKFNKYCKKNNIK